MLQVGRTLSLILLKNLFVFSAFSLFAFQAPARVVQILHTNDTHSFLNNTRHDSNTGGVSRLKSLIDYFKDRAQREGVATITLDGGDFLEGNVYYMADQGQKSFEAHNQIGFDAVVLGNHDYLMGPKRLDEILGNLDLNFSFLGANVKTSQEFGHLRDKLLPYKEIEIDGVKVAIMGLTTDLFVFTWSLDNSQITSPLKAAQHYEKLLKKRDNDFIIALTHIGVNADVKLAANTQHIDLIVGGHSHTELFKPVYEENKKQVPVPIVQAGSHTKYLGRLLVDLEKEKPLKVISYELVPVRYEAEDESMKALVKDAEEDLEDIYGANWLDEEIGHSVIKGDDHMGSKKWAMFIADAIRERSESQVAIHVSSMNGENYPVGKITRRDIINSFPRVFEMTQTDGWSIYTAKIRGSLLKTVCEVLAYFGQPLTFSGIEIEWIRTPLGIKVARARINGEKISPHKMYKVAFTEGIIRGALGISQKTKAIFRAVKKTEHKIWKTLEDKVASGTTQFTHSLVNEKLEHSFFIPE